MNSRNIDDFFNASPLKFNGEAFLYAQYTS